MKMYILILLTFFSLIISEKYVSNYYNNETNILNKYPKVDIDYIFSKPIKENNENKDNIEESKETKEIF